MGDALLVLAVVCNMCHTSFKTAAERDTGQVLQISSCPLPPEPSRAADARSSSVV